MKLNDIFAQHMVFARGKPIRIYGTGRGKARITFGGKSKTVVSEKENWIIEFPEMDYGGPYDLVFDNQAEIIMLNDIYIGEVYLFAGQSNMQFKTESALFDPSLYRSDDKLRLFSTERIEKTDYYTPKDGWVLCDKETVGRWSAIGYFTGMKIAAAKGIAVGVITCYQGASVIESWVPQNAFKDNGIDIPLNEKYYDHYCEEFKAWNGDGMLYDYALSQVIPFSLSAVVWYQGESDTSEKEAIYYLEELSVLINVWRNDFKDEKLPFVIIQIADFITRNDTAWRGIQKAQYDIQFSLPFVKCVISSDVCENDNIHPPTKDKLSARVALALLD